MKQSIVLKLGQHLTITPQLQQAIRLLQLSSLELQQEIQEALETNPLLEELEEETAKSEDSSNAEKDSEDIVRATDTKMDEGAPNGDPEADQEWTDPFETLMTPTTRSNNDGAIPDIDSRTSAQQSLRDHLIWQMQMTPFSDRDREIATAIIDAISDDGYLQCDLEEVRNTATNDGDEIGMDEVEAVLRQVQNFDPLGIGSRNLAECIRLQMHIMDSNTPFLEAARALATEENLALLASRDHNQLRRNLRLKQEDLQGAVQLIHTLNPRPGASINAPQASYIVPDIIVKKVKGLWRAELNSEVSPRLRIHQQYQKLIKRGNNGEDNKYLQEHLQQAKWFLKSLHSRNDTLLKVARQIIDRQRAFFDHGPEAIKPLVLYDIAEAVEMHESTISRVTTNKYMLTPRGVFELKYFFSSHVGTVDGGTCSATAIRSLIHKIIDAESTTKPVSDSKIAQLLGAQGIKVARRTIAKYRESMNSPASNLRKSLI